ncbi:MAG: hypothetical protein EU548_00025 [Promethearchaeota archaeon]|nr:MAG: hypothetical protein EU548_00025 [Candidatus Lokiarchaeota archaeon]
MTEYKITEEVEEEAKKKKRISIDFGRQGGVFIAYLIIILGFYGIIANTVMINQFGEWIPFTEMDRTLLIWPYLSASKNFFLPFLLLLIVSFALTFKEDIPAYGIKASLWLVPTIIAEGFLFYWGMFGISLIPFELQFLHIEGYINILLLFLMVIIGSFLGMYIKKFIVARKEKID